PSPQNYRYLLDMFVTIKGTNFIKHNKTLGYRVYDSCGDTRRAIKSTLQILSGTREPVPNYSCSYMGQIAGFIGDFASETTIPMAHILSVLGYTQVTYGATDPGLSDRFTFPYLFQPIKEDDRHYFIISKIVNYFGWNWVGIIVFDDDDRGDKDQQLLKYYLNRANICIEFTLKITSNKYLLYGEIIKKSSANVIIVCGPVNVKLAVKLNYLSYMLSEKTFIFTPNWLYYDNILDLSHEIFHGSLILLQSQSEQHAVDQLLTRLHPTKYPNDKLLENIWMNQRKCLSNNYKKNQFYERELKQSLHNCSGQEHLDTILIFGFHSLNMFSATHSLMMGLNNMLNSPTSGMNRNIESYRYKVNSVTCIRCPYNEWPNEQRDQCIAKAEEFLSYTDNVISVLFSSLSVFLSVITALMLGVFTVHRDTPIVRANNRSLSFLLLVSIKLSFLSVFLFLGRPVDITCMLRNITFGITFSIAVSSLLAKTIMVYIAFKATKPGSSWRKWIGVKLSNSVVLFCSSIQIIICMTWLAISPPFQELDLHTYPGTIIIQCNEGSAIGFYSVIGYMGLLAAVSFVLAFLARTLPNSFNEAKYITFSMLLFCSVWITMIPAYLSTKGKNTVCVEIFAILTSSAGLLACIFLPKCYIILFRPEMNTKSKLLENKKDNA
ncbi:hypothetical protein XELAEV_18004954mg, partial [Xenopus laevis]